VSRPRTLRSTQVEATVALLDLVVANPQVGANELMRQLGAGGVKVGRTEALAVRSKVRAVLAAAGLDEFKTQPKARKASRSFRTTPAGTGEVPR
jgi:hypothetical protein